MLKGTGTGRSQAPGKAAQLRGGTPHSINWWLLVGFAVVLCIVCVFVCLCVRVVIRALVALDFVWKLSVAAFDASQALPLGC